MKIKRLFLALGIIGIISFLFPERVNGIPAFARKYQISCQVCHSPAPRLKPFGEEFAGNGYRLTEYESPRYFIQTGDEKLSLLRELPLAIRLDGIASYNFGNSKSVDFGTLSGVKILSGGELSDKLSYYFYFFMSEGGDIVGVEDAFITYNDLFGTGLNISAGQFQVCDPFYKRELRLTLEDISILKVVPGQSASSLTYDRGIIMDYEIPGLNTVLIAEIVNGNGLGSGNEDLLFDNDRYKNVLGEISQPIGNWANIGIMGYRGKERLNSPASIYNNNIKIFGPVVNLDFDQRLMINMQYIKRIDSEVYLMDTDEFMFNTATNGAYIEAIYAPKRDMSKWYFTGLLNWIDSDINSLDYKSATLNLTHVLRRNIRLVGEYTYMSDETEYGKLSFGFIAAF